MFAILLCAPAGAEGPASADLRLIKRLSPEAFRSEPYGAPYIAVFQREKKVLVFVSCDHKDGIDSPGAKTVRKAIEDYRPQAVVVESLTADDPAAGREWLKAATWFAQNKPKELPENYHSAYAAHQRGIPFVGGEPSFAAQVRTLRDFGYTAEDLLGRRTALRVAAYNRRSPHDPSALAKIMDGHFKKEARALGLEKEYLYADFERWYVGHGPVGKPAHELVEKDNIPSGKPGANFVQRLGYALELMRETSIVQQIESQLKRHDRVLVVYGSGHLVRQREVWRRALGPSEDSKPF